MIVPLLVRRGSVLSLVYGILQTEKLLVLSSFLAVCHLMFSQASGRISIKRWNAGNVFILYINQFSYKRVTKNQQNSTNNTGFISCMSRSWTIPRRSGAYHSNISIFHHPRSSAKITLYFRNLRWLKRRSRVDASSKNEDKL